MYQTNLAVSYNNLGALYFSSGRAREAEVPYRRALAIHERLVRDHPDVPTHQRDLALCHNNLAVVANALGDTAAYDRATRDLLRQRKAVPA